MLLVDELAGFGVPLEEVLISHNGDARASSWRDWSRPPLMGHSVGHPELRTVGDPAVHFQSRLSNCGPLRAALLALTPLLARGTRSQIGRQAAATNGRLASVGTTDSAAWAQATPAQLPTGVLDK